MAKGPGGKSVGRVSIRVVPDSTRFKADLKKSLDRIEKSTVMRLNVAADTRGAEESVRKFVRDWNGTKVNLDVDANTKGASAHLTEFGRKRTVSVDVDVTKRSLAKAATVIASLSGARVVGNLISNVTRSLGNLDTALPKIAAVVLAVASIGAVALSSVGGLFTLAASLSALAGLIGPVPGILGAAATGAIVLGVALSSTKDQLAGLAPVWSRLKTIITDNFWDKARQPIIDFVQSTLPQLKAGLGPVSSALGAWAASVAAGFQTAFGGGALEGMLARLRESIDIASTGTAGFAHAIVTLGVFGAQYLPQLSQWLADITNRFDIWIGQVASDGTLAGWVNNALIVTRQLMSVMGSLFSIIGGISSAASAAGGGGLLTLETVLIQIASVVNSPAFQTTLSTLFAGAAAGVQGLLLALSPIGSLLQSMAPLLASLMGQLGTTLGTVISSIALALNSPAVSSGLVDLVAGLQAGLMAILPSLPAVANALGSVASFAGALAAQLGPVLGGALAALAPIVTAVLGALQPLIPILGQAFLQVIQALAPVIGQLVPALAPLVAILGQQLAAALVAVMPLIQALVPIITAVVPIVSTLVQAFAPLIEAILPILTQLVTAVTPIIQLLAQIFAQVAAALLPIISAILPPLNTLFQAFMPIIMSVVSAVMQLLQPILELITPLLQLIGPILGPLIQLFAVVAGLIASTVAPVVKALAPIFSGVASAIGDVLLPVIGTITGVLQGLIQFITGVFTGNWKQAWDGIVKIFSSIWNGIIDVGKGIINGVVDLINGLIGGVNEITSKIGIPAIPKIPKLAVGADITPTPGGTAVILGEGGRKETVTDYGRTNAMIAASLELSRRALAIEGGRGGNTISITEVSDPVGTAMAVLRRIEDLGA